MKETELLKELMDGITKENFETIRLTNQRPKSVPYNKYRGLVNLLKKMEKQINFQTKKYHK